MMDAPVDSAADTRSVPGDGSQDHHEDQPEASEPEYDSAIFKILYVDHNHMFRRLYEKLFRKVQCETLMASHGAEALEMLEQSNLWVGKEHTGFDLTAVLIKVDFPPTGRPIMDGLTCAKRIRELEVDGKLVRRVPIIAVLAVGTAEDVSTALSAGIDHVVNRQVRFLDLVFKIDELVRASALTAEDGVRKLKLDAS